METIKLKIKSAVYEIAKETLENSNCHVFTALVGENFKKEEVVAFNRDPKHFDLIIKMMENGCDPDKFRRRIGALQPSEIEELYCECDFYGMNEMGAYLKNMLDELDDKIIEGEEERFLMFRDDDSTFDDAIKEKKEMEKLGFRWVETKRDGAVHYMKFIHKIVKSKRMVQKQKEAGRKRAEARKKNIENK